MGYPRKSYPHRCSPPCAKRSRPRACARVYIIYRSPVGRSRGVSAPLWGRGRAVVTPCPAPACAGWGGRRQRQTPPRAATRTFPAYGPVLARLRPRPCLPTAESLCAKAECTRQSPPLPVRSPRGNLSTAAPPPACVPNHCVQRRKCTRQPPPLPVRSPRDSLPTTAAPPACVPNHCVQRRKCIRSTPPLPVRSPRGNLSTPAPLPAYGRTAVHSPRPCLPTAEPCRLCAESLCAKAEVHKAIPAPVRAYSPRQPAYGRAPAR